MLSLLDINSPHMDQQSPAARAAKYDRMHQT